MRQIILFFLLMPFFSFAQYDLTVVVTGFKPVKGKVDVSLYNRSQDFPKPGKEYRTVRLSVNGGSVKYTFKNLPPGYYAVATYHDANSNGKCDKNFLGLPVEGFGFSNNVRPTVKAPSFDQCKIYLDKSKIVNIKLIYLYN